MPKAGDPPVPVQCPLGEIAVLEKQPAREIVLEHRALQRAHRMRRHGKFLRDLSPRDLEGILVAVNDAIPPIAVFIQMHG